MRPVRITVNAVGNSQWVPLNYDQSSFSVGLAVCPWSTATGLTYAVQHCFDDLTLFRNVQVSRSGTTATVTDIGPDGLGHGLTTGDSVILRGTGSSVLDSPKSAIGNGDLGWTITVTSGTQYTYTCANSGPTADANVSTALGLRVYPHATLSGSTRQDGNYAFPPRAVRISVSAITAGAVDLMVLQGL